MKNILFILITIFSTLKAGAQATPVWVRDVNASPDTAYVFPVRTLNDDSNHVFVLSTYMKNMSPGVNKNKIYLKKYNSTGGLIWSLIYDHGGSGQPVGFDMVMDHGGNCYIAGGLMATSLSRPLLIKVNAGGSVVWERDSTTAFNTSNYDQVFYVHNRLHVKAASGVARFDVDGTELWSQGYPAGPMTVDNSGQSIFAVYFGNPTNIVRLDSSGVLNFLDTTINAERIVADAHTNFYLLADNFPIYELVKYDSAGNFQWQKNSFSSSAGFGDIGYEVLIDNNQDVILVGLNDTIYKLSPSGNLIWNKPMHGLDSYLISAKIGFNNLIIVAGSLPDATSNNLGVGIFNQRGDQNWSGVYNSNLTREFGVDLTIDNSGIYAIEDNVSNTTLVKYELPFFQTPIDFSLICVDSVWYDPANPGYVNTRVFNGNISSLNYPNVQAVSATGDTIINPSHVVNFFAHLGNRYQTYYDTITVQGITDFRNYTFLISESFGDTTVAINWCSPLGIKNLLQNDFKIYPNPVHDVLTIEGNNYSNGNNNVITIFNTIGSMILEERLTGNGINRIDVSRYADGIYFVKITGGNKQEFLKFVRN